MGLLQRLGRFLLGAPVRRDATTTQDDEFMWQSSFWTAPSLTGIGINQFSALNATAVLACVTMLTEDVAKLPWSIFRNPEGDTRKEAKDHWLYRLLQEPNDWQNGLEFREQMQVSLILRGNAYAVIVRDKRGQPVKFVPANADWVALWEAPTGELFYRVTPQGLHMRAELAGQPYLIPFEDVFHIRGFTINGLTGVSRIAVAREAIALGLGMEQQSARSIGQGAHPSGTLTTEQKLTDESAKRLKQDWKELVAGPQNAGKTAILEQGLKYASIQPSANDLDLINSRKFQMEEISRIFRIPLHMIGELTRSTNNNIQQQAQEYINYTLTGYTNRWRAKYSSHFGLWEQGLSVEFDYRELTTADMTSRINNWRTAIMSMINTPDEARLDLGYEPMGGEAAKLQAPQNMASMGSQSAGTGEGGRPPGGAPEGDSGPRAEALVQIAVDRAQFRHDQPRPGLILPSHWKAR